MQLEDYFDFISHEDIRLKGHRIGIDDVLGYYLEGYTPEEIAVNLPTLSLEQIYATITYYLHNQAEINAYMNNLSAWREQRCREWADNPSPVVKRLCAMKARQAGVRYESALSA